MASPRWFRDNWPHLLILVITNALSVIGSMQIAAAKLDARMQNAEERIASIESSHPDQTSWKVEQNARDIAVMQVKSDKMQADVASINAHLTGIDVKLETIVETLKAKH